MQIYGEDTLHLFEFDKLCEHLELFCQSRGAKEKARSLRPYTDRKSLTISLLQTQEYKSTLSNKAYFPDCSFEDFSAECHLLGIAGSVLIENQLSILRSASSTVNAVLKFLTDRSTLYPNLLLLTSTIFVTDEIIQAIDIVIDAHGQMKDSASPELAEIRSRLSSRRKEADGKFRSFLNDLRKKGWLREHEESFYNNRRVISIPSEYKREVKGIIHSKSESGKTTFIEPEGLVELNNEVAELEQDERFEVLRILRELTQELRKFHSLITAYHILLTELDFIRAKSKLAIELNAHLPQLSIHSIIELHRAVHPLLYLQNKAKGNAVIPLNIQLDVKQRMLIISGPNAGGKSITLKTVGLLQLMLQSGLLVPAAEHSKMCFFNQFMADIGDSQSIENALSTYSSRLIRMNHFLRNANGRSLILVDEFGTGTDPELGGAIAEVVLEELNKRNAFGIFTTHYTNIKLLADHLKGVQNASMLFDPETLQARYKLLQGQPGSSYTFEVAERIGLPTPLLDRAKQKVKGEKLKLNAMLAALHKEKSKLLEKGEDLNKKEKANVHEVLALRQRIEKLEEKIERDSKKLLDSRELAEFGRRLKNLFTDWETTKNKKEVIKKFTSTMTALLKKKAADNTPEKINKRKQALIERLQKEIKIGSKVRMLKSKQIGVVEDIKKSVVLVNFGNLKASVTLENLEPAED